jgi:orotidine-5'-phosphate decarboxylase
VGLDTDGAKIPAAFQKSKFPLFEFNKAVIDATQDLVCAYKPQIAYYAAQKAEDQLQMTIDYIKRLTGGIPVVLDAKRGDIGETAKMYAKEAFERFGAHAVTVNPYMGSDTLQPFLDYKDRGVIVLCKTSNLGSGELQDLRFDGRAIFEIVAEKAARDWNKNGNVCLVAGGTHIEELKKIRSLAGEIPLLVPGVGAQGGDVKQIIKVGKDSRGHGLMINASRSVIYAQGADFQKAVRGAAEQLVAEMRQ